MASSEMGLVTETVPKWNKRVASSAPVRKLKNERNAGRKPTNWQVGNMLAERRAGWSYRKIAKVCGLSVSTVHKLINEHKQQAAQ